MKTRLAILLGLLVLRLGYGWIQVAGFEAGQKLRLKGDLVRMDQKGSKCVASLGRFWFELEQKCTFSQGQTVVVVGEVRGGVIEKIVGQVWLNIEAKELVLLDEKEEMSLQVKLRGFFDGLREKSVAVLRRILPEPEASLVGGIVLGYKRLPFGFYNQLIDTGVVHIIVASGYNVMVVGEMVLAGLFWVLRRSWASLLAIGVMFGYALLAGFEPPVVRAAIMGSFLLVSRSLGRTSLSWWSLLLAAWLMVMVEPAVMGEIGFQLSVAASWGLIWLVPILSRWLEKLVRGGVVFDWLMKTELVPTLSAQLMTLPLILVYFGRFSPVSPLVNVLILPLVPLIMAWGGLALVLGIIFPPLGFVAGWLVYGLAHLLVVVVNLF